MKVFFDCYFKDHIGQFVIFTVIAGFLLVLLEARFWGVTYDVHGKLIFDDHFVKFALFFIAALVLLAISFAISKKLQNLGVKISYCIIGITSGLIFTLSLLGLIAYSKIQDHITYFEIIGLSFALFIVTIQYFELETMERYQESARYNPASSPFLN